MGRRPKKMPAPTLKDGPVDLLEFVRAWQQESVADVAKRFQITRHQVYALAARCRRNGVKLLRRTSGRPLKHDWPVLRQAAEEALAAQ